MTLASLHPVGGVDYPRTFRELEAWFPDEPACLDYLARLRWPTGFVCPRCGAKRAWQLSRGLCRCASCLGSYETAWSMLHKLRRAMVRPGRDKLSGEVEVDESYLGGVTPGKHGRGAEKKAIVTIAVEKRGRGMGRVRFARIRDTSGDSLLPAIEELIELGSVVSTDGHAGCTGVAGAGYMHDRHSLYASGDPAHVAMPRVHRVASLLKRWLLGTHQGAVRPQQLDYYLDEFTFRFNRRGSNHRGLLFYRLLEQAAQREHVPLAAIIGGRTL